MKTKDIEAIFLRAARFLEDHDWCQGAVAKDSRGYATTVEEGAAFCPLGAIMSTAPKIYRDNEGEILRYADDVVTNISGFHGLVEYNDATGRTKEEVVNMLKLLGGDIHVKHLFLRD